MIIDRTHHIFTTDYFSRSSDVAVIDFLSHRSIH